MKARLLYEMEVMEFFPGTKTPHAPPELVAQCVRRGPRLYAPIGTIIDDPQCHVIVLQGQAEAWDAECAAMTNCPPEALEARLQAGRRLQAGIHPDDFPAFDAGYIAGYDKDGNYKPGPNWDQWDEQKKARTPTHDEGI